MPPNAPSDGPSEDAHQVNLSPNDIPRPNVELTWDEENHILSAKVSLDDPVFKAVYDSAKSKNGKNLTPAETLVYRRYIERTAFVSREYIKRSSIPVPIKNLALERNKLGATINQIPEAKSPQDSTLLALSSIDPQDSQLPEEISNRLLEIGNLYVAHRGTPNINWNDFLKEHLRKRFEQFEPLSRGGLAPDLIYDLIEHLQKLEEKAWEFSIPPTADPPPAPNDGPSEQSNQSVWIHFDEAEIKQKAAQLARAGVEIPHMEGAFYEDTWMLMAAPALQKLGLTSEEYDAIMEKAHLKQPLTPEEDRLWTLICASQQAGVSPEFKATIPRHILHAANLLAALCTIRPASYENPTDGALLALNEIQFVFPEGSGRVETAEAQKLLTLKIIGEEYVRCRETQSIEEAKQHAIELALSNIEQVDKIRAQSIRGVIRDLEIAFTQAETGTVDIDLSDIPPNEVPLPGVDLIWDANQELVMISVSMANPTFATIYDSAIKKRGKDLTPAEDLVYSRYIERTAGIPEEMIRQSHIPEDIKLLLLKRNALGATIDKVDNAVSPLDITYLVLATIRARDAQMPADAANILRKLGTTYAIARGDTLKTNEADLASRCAKKVLSGPGVTPEIRSSIAATVENLLALETRVWQKYQPYQSESESEEGQITLMTRAALEFLEEKSAILGSPIHFGRLKKALENYLDAREVTKNYFPFTVPGIQQLFVGDHGIHEFCLAWASMRQQPTADRAMATSKIVNKSLTSLYEMTRNVAQVHPTELEKGPSIERFAFHLKMLLSGLILRRKGTNLVGPNWPTEAELLDSKTLEELKTAHMRDDITTYVDERLLLFHILSGAFRVTGDLDGDTEHLNVTKKADRDTVRTKIEKLLQEGEQTDETSFALNMLPTIFAKADAVFKEPVEAESSAPPAPPSPPTPPGGTPPSAPTAPEAPELPLTPSFQNLRIFANGPKIFKLLKKRLEQKRQTQTMDHINDLISRCHDLAVRVTHDVSGRMTKIEQKRTCPKILGGYIERRNPQKTVLPANIVSRGYFELDLGKKTGVHKLEFEVHNNGDLSFITADGEKHGKDKFVKAKNPNPLTNLYRELQRIALEELVERLERPELDEEQRFITSKGPQSGGLNVRTRAGGSVRIDPTKLIPSEPSANPGPIRPAAITQLILDMIDKARKSDPTDPITATMLEPITLYKKKFFTDRSGVDREIELPLVTSDAIDQLAKGKMSPDETFICTRRRGIERGGYNPHRRGTILECTPRTASDETEDLKDITEQALQFELSDEVEDLTTITVHPDITKIILGTRQEINHDRSRNITRPQLDQLVDLAHRLIAKNQPRSHVRLVRVRMHEIEEMLVEEESTEIIPDEVKSLVYEIQMRPEALREVSAETRCRLSSVVFNAEQNARYSKGKFESLTEQEAKLKDLEESLPS